MEVNVHEEVRDHPSKIKNIHWYCLISELFRLITFLRFPQNANKSAILLAEMGFAYIGSGKHGDDLVICCFCCVHKKGWLPTDDIMEVHRILSPDCSIVTTRNCNNIPLYAHDNFEVLFRQLKNIILIIGNKSRNIRNIHSELYSDSQNTTETTQSTPSSSQNPAGSSRNAPGSTQTSTGKATSAATGKVPTHEELGIITERPKSYEYAAKHIRLATFITWLREHHLKTEDLADAGFFYAGYGDRVRCFFCNGGLQCWTNDADVWVEHARWFPKCAFIRLKRGQQFVNTVQELHRSNVKISSEMLDNCLRNISPASDSIDIATDKHTSTATSGTGNETRTSQNTPNSLQNLSVPAQSTSNSSHTLTESTHNPPGSTQITTGLTGNLADGDLGLYTEHPQHIEYAHKETRLATFESWSPDHRLRKDDLADAGFYYTGGEECTCCFSCGGIIRCWENIDSVWVEHARRFPVCAYIGQKKGQQFVDAVQELNKSYLKITLEMVMRKLDNSPDSKRIVFGENLPARGAAVLPMKGAGYAEDDKLAAAKEGKRNHSPLSADLGQLQKDYQPRGNNASFATRAHQIIMDPPGNKPMDKMKEEINYMQQLLTCKVCMDKEVTIVFLPCGHLICCADCALGMTYCPVCRKAVHGFVGACIG